MSEKEIFELLGNKAKESISQISDWNSVSLKIKRLEKNVGFESWYTNEKNKKIEINTSVNYQTAKAIHALYILTQNHPLEHKNWNRAIFTLFPDNKFDMEYIWDQELQDRVDKFNKEN